MLIVAFLMKSEFLNPELNSLMEPGYSCHVLIIPHDKYSLENRLPDHIQTHGISQGANSNSSEDSWAPFYFSR